MIHTHEVLKPFNGAGDYTHLPGTRVNASEWANRKVLEDLDYIRELPKVSNPPPKTPEKPEKEEPERTKVVPPKTVTIQKKGD